MAPRGQIRRFVLVFHNTHHVGHRIRLGFGMS
jgi:hypothetical protein